MVESKKVLKYLKDLGLVEAGVSVKLKDIDGCGSHYYDLNNGWVLDIYVEDNGNPDGHGIYKGSHRYTAEEFIDRDCYWK